MSVQERNVDPAQTELFSDLAASWWDPHGPSRALHLVNPLRLEYVRARAVLDGRAVIDVGCGAGLLSEAMAEAGARVTAIDAAERMLEVARLHALERGIEVDYQRSSAERWCEHHPGHYDVVTCMELIEHVPDPASLVDACARLVRPGGHVFFSTINRTPKAWLLAVVGAEYVLRWLPRGTHDYRRLIRPSELGAFARRAGLDLEHLCGVAVNPVSERARLSRDVAVNYLAHLTRRDDLAP